MIFRHVIATTMVLAASSQVSAQGYLEAMDSFEFSAKLNHAAKSCETMGYTVDFDAIKAFGMDNVAAAVADGVSVDVAQNLALSALKEEGERQEFLNQHFMKNIETAEAAGDTDRMTYLLEGYFNRWSNTCAELSSDPRSEDFFSVGDSDLVKDWRELFGNR